MTPTEAEFTIRGLPPEIAVVPHWPADLHENGWRQQWLEWAATVESYRFSMLEEALRRPAVAAEERKLCAKYPEYFMTMYGWVYEPRDFQVVPAGWNPWLPFPHQVWALHSLEAMMTKRRPEGDGIWEKSRDMGATWIVCLYCSHQWLFAKQFSASLISYKEDMVDAALDPDSMFFKIEGILGILDGSPGLPHYLFDPHALNFNPVLHDRKLLLAYPGTAKVIKGSATTIRSGSGTRALLSVVDEAAKVDNLKKMQGSKRAAATHDLLLSSAYTECGPDFEEIAREAREDAEAGRPGKTYHRFDTRFHPLHDADWIAREKLGYEKDGVGPAFYREIMIDYHAGSTGWIYGDKVDRAKLVEEQYDPDMILYVGIDPGRRDDTAIVWASPITTTNIPTFRWLGVYERNSVTAKFYAHLLTGIPPEPGDDYYGYITSEEEQLMAFFRTAHAAAGGVEIVGDPAGNQKVAATPDSFYDVFMQHSHELRRRWRETHGEAVWCPDAPLVVIFGELHEFNDHDTRRWALHGVFDRGAVYADNLLARKLRERHRRYRFQERTREATTDPKPVHDEDSHAVAASEYMSVWLNILGAKQRKEEKKAVRRIDHSRLRQAEQRERKVA